MEENNISKTFIFKLGLPILLLAGLLITSFLVPVVNPGYDEVVDYLKDENGKIIAAPPFTPSEMPPAGSDRLGRNLLLLLLTGAKYTIFAALTVALLRIAAGFLFAVIYSFLPNRLGRFFKNLGESFQYIPLAIIVFALLVPLEDIFQEDYLTSTNYFVIQLFAIAFITIPSLAVYLGEEMKLFMKQEFIDVSRTMGASRFHIFRRHLLPQFRRNSIVLFSEQVSQALALFIQLGILIMALGGLKIADFAFSGLDPSNPVYFSHTNEWAATISININQIFITPTLVVVPLILFALTILCFNSISSTLRKLLIEEDFPEAEKVKGPVDKPASAVVREDLFTMKH
ncbi:ABC transporter permease subunit [Rossellomorea vietnamensis]|uniref:ABC transporter permease subunit n=1 Tax=Rossellomorea vietnamensis TaxID=218284 RepID=A0A5D4NXT3_9BACI|nr:ABC transporter permease subunit [Rossellomorea vietnamensis]TYS18591.1 ABC transporter permease subunit [Rossellomorea vietnamensis]